MSTEFIAYTSANEALNETSLTTNTFESTMNVNPTPSQVHVDTNATSRFEDGSNLWSEGMKIVMSSLIGAPQPKGRPNLSYLNAADAKASNDEPLRPNDVEAITSIWDIPRETIAMAANFSDGYEEQSFAQPLWPSTYSNEHHHQSSGFAPSYAPQQSVSASGLPIADAPRSRPGTELPMLNEPRDFSRRQLYPHSRNMDVSTGSYWSSLPEQGSLSSESGPLQDPRGHTLSSSSTRRSNGPPTLPETRGSRSWSNASMDNGAYEFPSSSLGKRGYEEEMTVNEQDAAFRRYSLAPNMVLSRPSSNMMPYRPVVPMDPRRSSLPAEEASYPGVMPMQPPSSRPYASPSWSSWNGSNPALASPGLGAGQHSRIPTAEASPGSNKRHRRQSSVAGGNATNTASVLANTPFHITTDIVLRAPAGSKLEDVYYDEHCEIQTGIPDPPASDFEVANEDDKPKLQTDKLRFPGDLYTPRWVRGTGNAREAWCDRCEQGNWLQLKNSQYWYDQVHKHGISSVSGLRFTPPTHLKIYSDAAGTVEAKCHQCKEWVLICTAKRRRNFAAFFKHAHACHSYRKASAVGNGPIVEHNPGHKKKHLSA